MLLYDEVTEIRMVLKHIHEIILAAEEYDDIELHDTATRYMPIIEESYKNFIELLIKERIKSGGN